MCGITGFIDFKNLCSLQILKQQNETLNHRGPDGGNELFIQDDNYQIGLAHRRLSIIDLSDTASQPMQYLHYTIVFNGEIYNYNEVKEELITLGHKFNNKSDTEVLLHAFTEWNLKMVDRLIGMFVFCIYDSKTKTASFCRDRAGVKPLYYYQNIDIIIFGSELKAIVANPFFKKRIERASITSFLQYGYVPQDQCIWQNTKKLSPGSWLQVDIEKKSAKQFKYWSIYDYYNAPKSNLPEQEIIKITHEKLIKACMYRMVADVPVGVFLSGGYDSSLVTAIIQNNQSSKLKTYTVGFNEQEIDESKHAKKVANFLGTDHTEYICTINEALNFIKDLPYYYDEPFADSSALPTMLVSSIARKDVTVALSADGGDEVFCGYNRYDYLVKYGLRIKNMPSILKKMIPLATSSNLSNMVLQKLLSSKNYNRLHKISGFASDSSLYNINNILLTEFTKNDANKAILNCQNFETNLFRAEQLNDKSDILSFAMAIDFENYMCDDILTKVDRATMAMSLEGREPLLDNKLVEWACTIPNSIKYKNGSKKHILKQITHSYLPEEMLNRPKMGFGIPVTKWLKEDIREYVNFYFSKEFIDQQNIFNYDFLTSIIADFYKNNKENQQKIWFLLMFQMWYEKWAK